MPESILIRIVDDDPDVLKGMSYLFEAEDYRTAVLSTPPSCRLNHRSANGAP